MKKNILKITTLLCTIFSFNAVKSQETLKADSTLSNLFYEVGIGFSNVGEMIFRGIDNQSIFPEHDQLSLSFSQQTKSSKYIRFGLVMGLYKEVVIGGKNNLINPFIITVGLEKKKTKNRWAFSYGSDLYYITTIKGTNVGGQYWQTQNPGLGLSGLVSGAYFIQKNLSIRTETEIGFGVQQGYKNQGFISQRVLKPSVIPIKTLSLELKYHF